ncbi:hypothetical protein [Pseudobutyrivibrio sp. MD2005]|uniref:hypothetical protein n=1 Tax=Pseudobutyrivibrio sp. MD2005 TaxID=1410616 RepID=UPI0004827E00|nr:hypothetical protein [Pseudobutyrivibrio sp. MD2005]
MQGEYKGNLIFRERYVALNEEAIKDEINRLQKELYGMQEILEFVSKDNNTLKHQVIDGQENNERLMKELSNKVQKLQDSLDYSTPLKAQVADATADFKTKMEEVYISTSKKSGRSTKVLIIISIVNTLLLLGLIGLIGYSIL